MGRLSGFRYRDIIKILKTFGFEFHRKAAASHEIWHNPITKKFTTIPNHTGDMPEGTLRSYINLLPIHPLSEVLEMGDEAPIDTKRLPKKYQTVVVNSVHHFANPNPEL